MKPTEAEAAAYFRLLAESCEDAIICVTASGEISFWNRAAERTLGYSEQEALGESISGIVHAESEGGMLDLLERIQRGDPPGYLDTVLLRRDGSGFDARLALYPVPAEGGERHVGFLLVRDVSETAPAEEELERAVRRGEDLDSIGTLVRRLAHQINNPLGGILMAAQFALASQGRPDSQATTLKALKNIEVDARRCGDIVKRALSSVGSSQEAGATGTIESPLETQQPEEPQ
jgi:PAS domain S-box-containing protein